MSHIFESAISLEPITRFFGNTPLDALINAVLVIVIAYFVYRWALESILITLRGAWAFWRSQSAATTFLEITPPVQLEKSPLATQHLMAILQQTMSRHENISLEIAASHQDGIRYLIRTATSDLPTLQRQLAAHLPEAHFRVLADTPTVPTNAYHYIHEVKQSRHYAYPLAPHNNMSQSDPIAYITGAMTKLEPGEAIIMQAVIAPHRSYWTSRLYGKIMSKGYANIDGKLRAFLIKHWWVWAAGVLIWTVSHLSDFTFAWTFILLVVSMFFIRREELPMTAGEQQLYQSVLDKLGQPLFRADIRVLVAAKTSARLNDLSSGVTSSLAPFNAPLQAFHGSRLTSNRIGQRYELFKLEHRLPSLLVLASNKLSASELASLYHFPFGTITTEDMVRSHSKTMPAPRSLKQHPEYDVLLGQNNHHGTMTDIGLTAADRQRHVYVIGGTGNGKTTMLTGSMIADITSGRGMAFIDPHGDAAETLLRYVPEGRLNDVVYFNPDDLARPIGLNLLELTEGLTGDDLLREKDLVTEATISVFRKIFSEEDEGGHRIEYVLRNAVQTALTQPDATLFTVFDLLNDAKYRKQVVSKLEDKDLKNFWQQEIGKAGDFQRVKMAAGITAKIGRFLFSASAKRILEQPKSTIDFDDILNSGKILICNFSKGLLGEDTSALFGITVLAKLQMAALRRARVAHAGRRPFYLYVDEFQNFATTSFVQMLSEARKYQLFMTLAEQSTSQQKDQRMVQVILANVGALVCFRTGNPADEELLLPFFHPYIHPGEISNLPAYNFYMRISGIKTQEPFSGITILPSEEGSAGMARKVTEHSRQTYGREPKQQSNASSPTSPGTKPAVNSKPSGQRLQKRRKATT